MAAKKKSSSRPRPGEGPLVGSRAPAFTLPDADGEKVRLTALEGKWVVLYFYPKDDTPGCTVEAQEFTALAEQFAEEGAVVLGVSPDAPERHARFREKYGLAVRLLSDPDHAVMEKYGAWGEKSMYGRTTVGVIRSTVIIDPKRRIVAHWPKVRAKGHAEKVLEKLRELKAAT